MPTLIENCWRVIGPSNRPIVCGLYEGAAGRVEVRCHYGASVDHLFRSEVVEDFESARDLADEWQRAAVEKGFTLIEEN